MGSSNLVQLIKRIAMEVYSESKPCDVMTGRVTSESPLKIAVGNKMILDNDFLIISSTAKEKMKMKATVIMLRQNKGQKFFVIDTV